MHMYLSNISTCICLSLILLGIQFSVLVLWVYFLISSFIWAALYHEWRDPETQWISCFEGSVVVRFIRKQFAWAPRVWVFFLWGYFSFSVDIISQQSCPFSWKALWRGANIQSARRQGRCRPFTAHSSYTITLQSHMTSWSLRPPFIIIIYCLLISTSCADLL